MSSESNKFVHTDEVYSPELDLLLDWGQTHLLAPQDKTRLKELQEAWQATIAEKSKEEWSASLAQGLEHFEARVEAALKFLKGEATLDVEEAYEATLQALNTLDAVVFLWEAVCSYREAEINGDIVSRVGKLLEKVTFEEPPSGLRLTPLNEIRRQKIEIIPEEQRYLFPWYSNWAELPTDTLQVIVEQWDSLAQGRMMIGHLEPELIPAILAAVKEDQELFNHLREAARIPKILAQALNKSPALRLYTIGQVYAGRFLVPNLVLKYGLESLSNEIIKNLSEGLYTDLERNFCRAFCSPMDDEGERLRLFKKIEKEVSELLSQPRWDLGSLSPRLRRLISWFQGSLTDQALAEQVFSEWIRDLYQAAWKKRVRELFISVSERAHRILNQIFPGPVSIPASARAFLGRGAEVPIYYEDAPFFLSFMRPVVEERSVFELKENPVEMPLKEVQGQFSLLVSNPEIPEYHKLYQFLQQVRFYWVGWVFKEGQEPYKIPEDKPIGLGGFPCFSLPKDRYHLVILAVSTEQKKLEELVKRVEQEGGPIVEPQPLDIAFILYEPLDKGAGYDQASGNS